jgi:hypothetical protein
MIINFGEFLKRPDEMCSSIVETHDIENDLQWPWLTKENLNELQTKMIPGYENKPIIKNGLFIHKNNSPDKIDGEEMFREHPFFKKIFREDGFFKNNPKTKVIVSNYGRIWVDDIMDELIDEKTYYKNSLYIKVLGRKEKVHRLVAQTWNPNPAPCIYKIVHHIDNNGFNNLFSNLLWVTYAQHAMIHLTGKWQNKNKQILFENNNFELMEYKQDKWRIIFNGTFVIIGVELDFLKIIFNINGKEIISEFSRTEWSKIEFNNFSEEIEFPNGKWKLIQ